MKTETKRQLQVVDDRTGKAPERSARNRIRNRKQADAGSDWDFIPRFYIDALKAVGAVLYIPLVLFMAILEGIRTGFIRGLRKALELYR